MSESPTKPVHLYAVFHCNLAFSSLAESERSTVISRCYWPLLNLIESHQIPIGIELTAFTLECIQELDADWVQRFSKLLKQGKCELLASGDSQIIGPLVPAKVNSKNLILGLNSYEAMLGIRPNIAYVNEQACSSGLLDVYLDCGITTVMIEWNNPFSFNREWRREDFNQPRCLDTASGRTINVIWNNAIAFQKLQRFAHGETIFNDYLDWLKTATEKDCQYFCIYGSDAEVFDFRPGRYPSEASQLQNEWDRIEQLFCSLKNHQHYQWVLPKQTLDSIQAKPSLLLNNASHPISVKKQAKYNVTRWGLSGRNDLILNTLCYQKLKCISKEQSNSDDEWRQLSRLWASDNRTHLSCERYQNLNSQLASLGNYIHSPIKEKSPADKNVVLDEERNKLHINTESLKLTLSANRGLAIESLSFKEHEFKPICGTLCHGFFDHISYGVDFYSNHLVMERFKERDRVTDLSNVAFKTANDGQSIIIRSEIPTHFGNIHKQYCVSANAVDISFEFETTVRPESSLRLGFFTLLNCDQRLWFACHNGGYNLELFNTDCDFDHGAPVSSIVSANNAVGATEGELFYGNSDNALHLQWDPAQCAALPMLSSKQIGHQYLNRMWFSLVESDETLKPDGTLLPFNFRVSPSSKQSIGLGS